MERNLTSGVLTWGRAFVLLGLLSLATSCATSRSTAEAATSTRSGFDVTDFGANGSDEEDNTAAFNAAIAAATPKHGQVNVPPGVYIISDQLNLDTGVSLVGAGMQRTRLQVALKGGTKQIANLLSVSEGSSNVVIADLEIAAGGHVENVIRSTGGTSNLRVQRCWIHHAMRGIEVDRASGQFLDNLIHDMSQGGVGIGFSHESRFIEMGVTGPPLSAR